MASLVLNVTASPDAGSAPLTVYFQAFVSGGTPPYFFDYKFGDNTPDSFTQNTLHTYAAGSYNASCKVTDSLGVTATVYPILIVVSAAVPNATFTQLSGQVCAAGGPASLTPIPTPPSEEAIPAGVQNEAIPISSYYDRCVGEYVAVGSTPSYILTLLEA